MFEQIILENLLHNEPYLRKVLPFIKTDYFDNDHYVVVYEQIVEHVGKYNKIPTKDELVVELTERKGLRQQTFEEARDLVAKLEKATRQPALDWLLEKTEKFCQDKALYNAIIDAAAMIDEKDSEVGGIPDLLKNALSVTFDTNVGHDYTTQIEERYRTLHQTTEYKVPFDLEDFNEITDGGLPKKTLTVISASTGAGKSLFLCHNAAYNLKSGKNVLYITMEMAEERISERIDSNLTNIAIQDLSKISLQDYTRRLKKALEGVTGRLIVKEYPTSSAGVLQFRALLNELQLKKDFKPDIIYVDYVNICTSSRFKAGQVNSYQYIKGICEELRGLAIEYDLPIVSATQLNREGTDNTDVGLKEISESHGLSATVDMLFAMMRSEELDQQNLVMFKQLKNRFSDMSAKLRFVVGIDRSKMKLFNSAATHGMTSTKVVADGNPESFRKKESKDNEYKPSIGKPMASAKRRFSDIKI